MSENLLDPLSLFFLVGGVPKSDLKSPDAVYHLPGTYLLRAIGRKGGVQWAQPAPTRGALPALATPGLGFTDFKPILGFCAFGNGTAPREAFSWNSGQPRAWATGGMVPLVCPST